MLSLKRVERSAARRHGGGCDGVENFTRARQSSPPYVTTQLIGTVSTSESCSTDMAREKAANGSGHCTPVVHEMEPMICVCVWGAWGRDGWVGVGTSARPVVASTHLQHRDEDLELARVEEREEKCRQEVVEKVAVADGEVNGNNHHRHEDDAQCHQRIQRPWRTGDAKPGSWSERAWGAAVVTDDASIR